MRKLMIFLVALGLLVAFPAAAGAKKPPRVPKLEGQTCAERTFEDPLLWQVGSAGDDFTVKLTTEKPAACFDVSSSEGVWSFDLVTTGSVDGFQMHVKNSVPGDKCWAEDWKVNKKHSIPGSWESPLTPAAAPYACGDRVATDEDPPLVFMPSFWGAEDSSLTITVNLP